ncbi:MAG: hypothetical protein L0220_25710 [Acidobacteria bacterium]|nr:hypothetical protein [Acidobacteriota bacterium]
MTEEAQKEKKSKKAHKPVKRGGAANLMEPEMDNNNEIMSVIAQKAHTKEKVAEIEHLLQLSELAANYQQWLGVTHSVAASREMLQLLVEAYRRIDYLEDVLFERTDGITKGGAAK